MRNNKPAEERKLITLHDILPRLLGEYVLSGKFAEDIQCDLQPALEKAQKKFKIGMQRYLALGYPPYCFVVVYTAIAGQNGFPINELTNINEFNIPSEELEGILDKLISNELVYQKDDRIYLTSCGESVLKEAGIL